MKITILPILLTCFLFLTACGGGGSNSGSVQATAPGQNLPSNFIGTYTGILNVRAEALGISERDSFPVTITVTADGMITFESDGETFTVGVTDAGDFSGNLSINEPPCMGTIGVTGQVDGTTASGTVSGEGECDDGGLTIDVELTGDFNATK